MGQFCGSMFPKVTFENLRTLFDELANADFIHDSCWWWLAKIFIIVIESLNLSENEAPKIDRFLYVKYFLPNGICSKCFKPSKNDPALIDMIIRLRIILISMENEGPFSYKWHRQFANGRCEPRGIQ